MIRFIFSTIILISLNGYSQVFNETFGDDGFEMLTDNPLVYVKTGDPAIDQVMEESLESIWTLSDYVILEPGTGPSYNQCFISIIVARESSVENYALAILPGEYYTKPAEYTRAVAYMFFNGFYTSGDYMQPALFIKLMIGAFHSTLKLIKDTEITGPNKSVEYGIIKKASGISNKRLVVYDQIMEMYVPEIELTNREINYVVVDKKSFTEMIKNPQEGDYMIYLAKNMLAEFSILNMVDGSLLLTKHTAISNIKSRVRGYLNLIDDHF